MDEFHCAAQPGIDNRKKVAGEPERAKDKVRLAPGISTDFLALASILQHF
jgi:hypothetical protein